MFFNSSRSKCSFSGEHTDHCMEQGCWLLSTGPMLGTPSLPAAGSRQVRPPLQWPRTFGRWVRAARNPRWMQDFPLGSQTRITPCIAAL